MTHEAERLERIAAVVPPNRVRIVKLRRNIDIFAWLCGDHVEARKALGWEVVETNEPPHPIACQDCPR